MHFTSCWLSFLNDNVHRKALDLVAAAVDQGNVTLVDADEMQPKARRLQQSKRPQILLLFLDYRSRQPSMANFTTELIFLTPNGTQILLWLT